MGIAIHIVRRSDGSDGVSEAALQEGLQRLIAGFAPAHIDFLIVKRDTIDNDYYAVSNAARQDELAGLYNVPHAINIYYIPQPGEAGVATFSPSQMSWFNSWYPSCGRYGQSDLS